MPSRLNMIFPPLPSRKPTGSIMIFAVVVIFIFSLVMLGTLAYASFLLRTLGGNVNGEAAFQIAEAGVNYYQWHLAEFPVDYKDGTNQPGPYVHNYTDTDSQTVIGKFSLVISQPPVGSTIVTVQSTGWTLANPSQTRTVTVRYGIPSLAQYAFLSNSWAWIGSTESINGPFFSNNGIRFDGTGNAPIQSAKSTYVCPWQSGCGAKNGPGLNKPGIWGTAPLSTQNFWQFPVSNISYSSITGNLASIKSDAQAAGIYLPTSNSQGYSLVFNSAGTVSVYKVTSLRSNPVGYDINGVAHNEYLDYNNRTLQYTTSTPANGLIYVEDRTWVEGTIHGRALVAAAKLPYNANTAPDILIPNSIVYSAKDGSDVLGLIAQQDFLVTYHAPTNLEIDAAFIAQNGSAELYNYNGVIKNILTIYGALSSYGIWTWSWVDGSGNITAGYTNTVTNYDPHLLYGPPPSFPLTTNGYQQISWSSN